MPKLKVTPNILYSSITIWIKSLVFNYVKVELLFSIRWGQIAKALFFAHPN